MTALDLRALCVGGHSLAAVERMYTDGRITVEVYADYYQLWRRAAPRFSEPYVYSDADVPRPAVVGPLAAATIARFLDYCARGVLFIDWS